MTQSLSPELVHWLETQRELTLLMAHDLRNPLAAVMANLNFLELAVDPGQIDVLEAVGDIKLSAETLLRMIENLVAIARLETGKGPPVMQRVDVVAAAHAAFERAMPAAKTAGVDLVLEVRDGGGTVAGDPALLELLIENLVGNATQHARHGQRAKVTVASGPSGVTIALDDEGPPFGPTTRDFSRDGQLELKKRSDARYSRGLALYVVGLVAHALGGSLEAGDGHGGHVKIVFPPPAR